MTNARQNAPFLHANFVVLHLNENGAHTRRVLSVLNALLVEFAQSRHFLPWLASNRRVSFFDELRLRVTAK